MQVSVLHVSSRFGVQPLKAGYHQPLSLLYVGSTAIDVTKRHLNRVAVFKHLKKTELVDAELALRYWESHDNLFECVIVPLINFQDYQSAWSFEHELIAQWQTPLNFPRATQFLKKTALGYSVSQKHRMSAHSTYGLRLWRKLGKRLHGCRKDCRKTAWNILFDLGSFTKASHNAARLIRSRSMSNDELCALMKLRRRNVAHPARGENQSLLKSAVKFRTTMHWPKSARPLGVLPLAHPSFNSDWEGWLKSIVSDFKYLFPPFHVPRGNLREVLHQSIKKFLRNFQGWEEQMWGLNFNIEAVACPCSQFLQKLPDHCFVDGHVAAALEDFKFPLLVLQARSCQGRTDGSLRPLSCSVFG